MTTLIVCNQYSNNYHPPVILTASAWLKISKAGLLLNYDVKQQQSCLLRSIASISTPWSTSNFSKVGLLLKLLCKITLELTSEKFCQRLYPMMRFYRNRLPRYSRARELYSVLLLLGASVGAIIAFVGYSPQVDSTWLIYMSTMTHICHDSRGSWLI